MAKTSLLVGMLGIVVAGGTGCSPERSADGSAPRSRASEARRTSTLAAAGSGDLGTAARAASAAPDSGDAQWVIPAKNYASTRYSGLSQITSANVGRLRLAWTISTGVIRGHEAAPLVVGSTMYVVTPYPNILYALDLSQPGGPLKWKYE